MKKVIAVVAVAMLLATSGTIMASPNGDCGNGNGSSTGGTNLNGGGNTCGPGDGDPRGGPGSEYTSTWGLAIAGGIQFQNETQNPFSAPGIVGFTSSQDQFQGGAGGVLLFGKSKTEFSQLQVQGGEEYTFFNSYGKVTWFGLQSQEGSGSANRIGGYVFGNTQQQDGGSLTLVDGDGTFGFAGSGYTGEGSSFAGASYPRGRGSIEADASQFQVFKSSYQTLDYGENGYTSQQGRQAAFIQTGAEAYNGETAKADAWGKQLGGSVVVNDGAARDMSGGMAMGAATGVETDGGNAKTLLKQSHSYEQASYNTTPTGSSFQYQTATGSTKVGTEAGGNQPQ